jgi:hypothetical protein
MEGRQAIQASNLCTQGCASEASEESNQDSEKGSAATVSEHEAFQIDMDRLAVRYTGAGAAAAIAGVFAGSQTLIETAAGIISAALFILVIATVGGFKEGFYSLKRKKPRRDGPGRG